MMKVLFMLNALLTLRSIWFARHCHNRENSREPPEHQPDLRGDINISRLLDRERNGAANRRRGNRHLVPLVNNLEFDLRICLGIREGRVDKSAKCRSRAAYRRLP